MPRLKISLAGSSVDTPALPNFFIIGAMRSATTSLHKVLSGHPQVYCTRVKETQFFSDDRKYAHGLDWYARTYFEGAHLHPARGESSTHYLYWGEKVAPRLAVAYRGDPPRLISILRDPVMRAYSHYWLDVSLGIESHAFEDAIALEHERLSEDRESLRAAGIVNYGYLYAGCYAARLRPFLSRFARRQFHFILQEDLRDRFSETMTGLGRFLDVDDSFAFEEVQLNPAVKRRSGLASTIYQRMTQPFLLKEAVKSALPKSIRARLRRVGRLASVSVFSYPPIPPETERALRLRFAPDVRMLETIINRDLSAWLPQ